jgi:outer membrane receptor for ferric coprogen and ferric-rhodotorulic acid
VAVARAVSQTYYKRDGGLRPGGKRGTARLGYRFNKHLSSSLTANNLFDRKYYERVDSAWGRTSMASRAA